MLYVCAVFIHVVIFAKQQVSCALNITGRRPQEGHQHGTVWYAMLWYGMVWYGMVWYGMVWYGMVWYGMVWYGMVWYGMVWYGMVWYGMLWYGMVWHCMAWHGMAWYGMVRRVCDAAYTHVPQVVHIHMICIEKMKRKDPSAYPHDLY